MKRDRVTYPKVKAERWYSPRLRDYRLCCCGCGLVHSIDFRVRAGRPELKFALARRSTAAVRRAMKAKGVTPIHGRWKVVLRRAEP